jgi:hypothetical protein
LSVAAAHKTDTRADHSASATDADLIVLAIQISALCSFGRNSRDQRNIRLQAVKWRNWKMHFYRQDNLIDPRSARKIGKPSRADFSVLPRKNSD